MSKPFVTIETAGRLRRLRFGMNQLALLEDLIQRPVSQLNAATMGMKELRAAFCAGLSWEDRDLTLEQTGDLIDEIGLVTVSEKVGEALEMAFGPAPPVEGAEKNGQAPGSGTGA